jgi:membrane AbrB-like protein
MQKRFQDNDVSTDLEPAPEPSPSLSHLQIALRALLGLAVGTAGGAVFDLLHSPLPWTLGALTATAIVTIAGREWFLPVFVWNIARPFVGVLAGSAFTLPVVLSILDWWSVVVAMLVYSAVMTLIGWVYFGRLCKFDNVTAFFASAPGGLGELTLLGGTLGGNVRRLALVHSVRIIAVVFIVPFLVRAFFPPVGPEIVPHAAHAAGGTALDYAVLIGCGFFGFFAGKPWRNLGGIMLAPMIFSAAAHATDLTHVVPPSWLIACGQVVIGVIAGTRFAGVSWRELHTTVLQGFGWALILVAAAMVAALICSFFAPQSFTALLLAFAPGGIVEITIVAYAIGVEVAFVVTCHVCRVVAVLLVAPGLFRLIGSKAGR